MNEKLILVVDDEPDICMEIGGFLKAKGFDVITAYNGQDGVKLFKQMRPILVLSDYKMPLMNGIELLKAVKALDRSIHVVLISGAADSRTIVEGMKEDAFDFLLKPIDLNNLLEIIKTIIAKTHANAGKDPRRNLGSPFVPEVLDEGTQISVLYFNRDLDEYTAPKYEEHVRKLVHDSAIRHNIVFLMSNVKYINNMGLNLLINLDKFIKEKGYNLHLCSLSPQVDFYLRTLGYTDYFDVDISLDSLKARLVATG